MTYFQRIQKQVQELRNVPLPSTDAIGVSESLYNKIVAQIERESISFFEFMDQVLYTPGMGYYAAGSVKIGESGDFITAPEMSPLFARCIAVQAQQVMWEGW